MIHSLFSEFVPVSKEEWIKQATKDLKGKDFGLALKSKLWEKIDLDPFYTLEDLKESISSQVRFHSPLEIPGMPPRNWSNVVSVLAGDSNKDILHSLENGAEGLVLHLNGYEDLEELLKAVQPEYISMHIKPVGNPLQILGQFLTWVEKSGIQPEQLKGGFLWSPSDMVFEQNEKYSLALEVFSEVMELTETYSNFKSFSIQSSRYSESGSNPLDALVFSYGELMELIDKSGSDTEAIFKKMLLEVSVGDSHFGEIARLKAFRLAAVQLAAGYGLNLKPENIELLCQTSHWSKSILDVNTNLIRQTYEAMAGVLGGANFLWIKPFQEESAGELDRRIARNVSTILREEANLDKVMDPAAGSYFMENLTPTILEYLKENLQNLEKKGGWLEALETGKIHQAVRAHRQKIQSELLDQKRIKVGANKYPASDKLKNEYDFEVFEEKSFEMKPTRATYLFELQNQPSL
ncbi:methylmalonyl-CoA mutase family protein [Algoriphagus mannitolivorans]|uniref:methylmalonyl-CoA mutase family protein n=1 Tax=Algoriphagus mannitolivorans TaxID=226504 RepID=UPI000409ADB9|nr:methylmalonyl-CoA mutase family protein [Algoriphagus mannitolivorans]